MPIKSEKQRKLMQAVSHSKSFAKKVDIPQKVAKEMLHPKKKK
jgi:hypothetical protein